MHTKNNFDILRLLFALIVVLVHCAALSVSQDLAWIPKVFNSQIAVEGFFVMSGFLIVGSYERTPTWNAYVIKRARRILPAYWAALVFCLILGAVLTKLTLAAFLRSHDTWFFAVCNLTFANYLHPSLPGVFLQNPGETAMNGALWTIKLEVMFYAVVPAIVWACQRIGKWQVPAGMFLLSLGYRLTCLHFGHTTLAKQMPGQLCFFAGGVLVYYYLDEFKRNRKLTWLLIATMSLAYLLFGGLILEALAIPLATLGAAFLLPHWSGPSRYGDFSYGTYVFHFPILQALISAGAFKVHAYYGLLEALLAVSTLAILSWYCVEAPCLKVGRFRGMKSTSVAGA